MARKRTTEGSQTDPKTKVEAVRRALAEGVDSPTEGVAFIKEHFGLEVSPGMFSAYKSQMRSKKGKPGRKPGRKPKSESGTASAAGVSKAPTTDNLVGAVATVQQLVQQLGAETVRGLVDLFA
jgi:hypothetical protein